MTPDHIRLGVGLLASFLFLLWAARRQQRINYRNRLVRRIVDGEVVRVWKD